MCIHIAIGHTVKLCITPACLHVNNHTSSTQIVQLQYAELGTHVRGSALWNSRMEFSVGHGTHVDDSPVDAPGPGDPGHLAGGIQAVNVYHSGVVKLQQNIREVSGPPAPGLQSLSPRCYLRNDPSTQKIQNTDDTLHRE